MKLSYVNVFAKDIVALSGFYKNLFGFEEIVEIRSPIFVGLNTRPSCLGFNAQDVYKLLELEVYADPTGANFLLNIGVDTAEEVNRLTPIAVAKGVKLIKKPYLDDPRGDLDETQPQCVELGDAPYRTLRHRQRNSVRAGVKKEAELMTVAFVQDTRSAAGCVFQYLM